jgi:hypothetical protein
MPHDNSVHLSWWGRRLIAASATVEGSSTFDCKILWVKLYWIRLTDDRKIICYRNLWDNKNAEPLEPFYSSIPSLSM